MGQIDLAPIPSTSKRADLKSKSPIVHEAAS
jgi:hypothetical protein